MSLLGLNIGLQALKAQQRALDVTGHNIANANTEGYSRQRAELTATEPYTVPSLYDRVQAGQVGTGVEVKEIVRLRNAFLDGRFRDESAGLGEWSIRRDALHEIELIFNEPSDGLSQALTNFWSSLSELQNNPESSADRASVRQSALSMIDVFHSYDKQLDQYQYALDGYVKDKVSEINTISASIADLNKQIAQIVGNGDHPNDLLDQRDLLIDNLSKLVGINVTYDSGLRANITIGGYSLVAKNDAHALAYQENSQKNGLVDIVWESNNASININSGELYGLLKARDEIVPNFQNELDTLARTFVFEFNQVHQSGYGLDNSTGTAFFTGADAENINLSDDIKDPINGLTKIAAASALDSPGDASNALLLSQVVQSDIVNGKSSVSDYWAGIVTQMGIEGSSANQMAENQVSLTDQIDMQRDSIMGVSLDEEMVNMIKFQQVYGAAAQLINVQSEMLDTLVNGIIK